MYDYKETDPVTLKVNASPVITGIFLDEILVVLCLQKDTHTGW